MKTFVSSVTVAIGIVATLSFSFAQESGGSVQESGGFVQEDPHEHGAASLNAVLENDTLSMEFVSPAVNLVGFEYEPSSEEETQAVEDALAQLEDGATLFTPAEAAGCELTSAETEHLMTDEEGHEEGEEHSEEEEHIEGESGAEEYAEDEEHDEDAEGAQHSEFHAEYTFTCANPDSLSSVALNELFALYPGIEDLDVQYVLPNGQGAAELSPTSNTTLSF